MAYLHAETVSLLSNPMPIIDVCGNQQVTETVIYENVRYRTEAVRF